MKFFGNLGLGLLFVAVLIAVGAAQSNDSGCSVHLQYGKNAVMTTFDNIRDVRYGEISLICGSGPGNASMYNTLELNGQTDANKDSCPAALWNNVSEDAMAQQFGVPSVWKNGPRFWTVETITLPLGTELDFNGLNARWFAYPTYPPNIQSLGITAGSYIKTYVKRESTMTFYKDKPVFMLIDPSGNPYVMQAAAMIVNQNLTYNDLFTLGNTLQMPAGWKYQTKVLPQNLTITALSNGTAIITQDSLGNSYDICINGTCNYIP
jgi:hypothetical protein